MPEVPFQVNVAIGAKVWNQWGTIAWGYVTDSLPQPMTVSLYRGDKYVISSPVWPDNGKEFTVLQSDCTIVDQVQEPEPEPEPEPEVWYPPALGYYSPDGTQMKIYVPKD